MNASAYYILTFKLCMVRDTVFKQINLRAKLISPKFRCVDHYLSKPEVKEKLNKRVTISDYKML